MQAEGERADAEAHTEEDHTKYDADCRFRDTEVMETFRWESLEQFRWENIKET